MKRMLPTVASFLVSEDCNLACTYCFELEGRESDGCSKHMTKEVARQGLEYLCNNAIKMGDNQFGAMLFGGEPLINPDIVEEILSYGEELSRKHNINFSANMVTNATILTDRIKYILTKYMRSTNLSVQLSVDGIKEIHDRYRVTKNGKGSFDMIAKNIEGWKELFKDNIHALSVHGCSNHDTLPYLFENFKFFREEWDIPRVWFLTIDSDDWVEEDIAIYERELGKIADYTLECAKRDGNAQEVYNYAPLDRCFSPDMRPDAPCGAGKNFVTITAMGDIYPCHSFYFNDPEASTKLGDVWEGIDEPKRNIYIAYGNEDMSCAKKCPGCTAYQCYRCIADNWTANGSIFSQIDGIRCDMSMVERKMHLKLREELSKMGLFNNEVNMMGSMPGNNLDNPNCLCDCRTTDEEQFQGNSQVRGIDNSQMRGNSQVRGTVSHTHSDGCKCGNGSDDNETLALAIKIILEKIDGLETGQDLILKRLLK